MAVILTAYAKRIPIWIMAFGLLMVSCFVPDDDAERVEELQVIIQQQAEQMSNLQNLFVSITGTLSQLEQQGKVGSSETLALLQDQLKLELTVVQKLLDDLSRENTNIRDQLKTLEQDTTVTGLIKTVEERGSQLSVLVTITQALEDTMDIQAGQLSALENAIIELGGTIYVEEPWIDYKSPLPKEVVWEKDGSKMKLIPAGEFQMGHDTASDTRPVHTVYTDAFYMDEFEVTVGQFKKFVEETNHTFFLWPDVDGFSPSTDHPMVSVSWYDAMTYAHWAGKRLPTEAEWEKAARGGLKGKMYPWGDEEPNDKVARMRPWSKDITAPVGSYPANGYGLYDMAGNAAEWVLDRKGLTFYHYSPRKNPCNVEQAIPELINKFQFSNDHRNFALNRGGGALQGTRRGAVYSRDEAWTSGFRCVKSAKPIHLIEWNKE